MEKIKITNDVEAQNAMEVAVDTLLEGRLYEFCHNLMLEAEGKVEESFDVSPLEENLDSGERWCDSLRTEIEEYIWGKVKKMLE